MEELNCGFFNPNWETQTDPFQSALSSIVSSPTNANANNNSNIVLQELIGRLDTITNNTETFPSFPFSDLGFVDKAARFPFYNDLAQIGPKLDSIRSQEKNEFEGSRNVSSISEQIQTDTNSRKRKSLPKGKGKETSKPAIVKDTNVVGSESNESSPKRTKSDDSKSKDSEPFKDYIHVRARRGQATDAHSLAERVRREKIGERMKFLQDLVPGCNKVTGKAVMLDEIINYVQSLQRQVEFLSMKLSTVNPRMELNMETLVSKDMFQSRGTFPSDCYPFQSQPTLQTAVANGAEALNHFNAALGRSQLPPMNNCPENPSQVSTFWENDLHNFVQMGYIQDQIHGAQMKVEP